MHRWLVIVMMVGCRGMEAMPAPDARPLNQDETGRCGDHPPCPDELVCTRFQHFCLPSQDVYTVHVRWTIRGLPPSAVTCAPAPDLSIGFKTSTELDYPYGAAPVPCRVGLFSVDHVNRTVNEVALGALGGTSDTFPHTMIDPATGDATIDLTF